MSKTIAILLSRIESMAVSLDRLQRENEDLRHQNNMLHLGNNDSYNELLSLREKVYRLENELRSAKGQKALSDYNGDSTAFVKAVVTRMAKEANGGFYKINAIREVRGALGWGLKESKDAVEAVMASLEN